MASSAKPETLALQRLYQWEKSAPDKLVFTQPMGGGVVKEYTWKQALAEVRRMAAYLKSLNLEPGTRIAPLAGVDLTLALRSTRRVLDELQQAAARAR